MADAPAADPSPASEPEDGEAFFAAALAEHGRCTCADDREPCEPSSAACALCNVLPRYWPCPTPEHDGYPKPDKAGDRAAAWAGGDRTVERTVRALVEDMHRRGLLTELTEKAASRTAVSLMGALRLRDLGALGERLRLALTAESRGGDTARALGRRLAWSLYIERSGVGSIVTDLDTEQWAAGSAETEQEARAIARRRLDETPSGGTSRDDADLVAACRAAVLRPGDVPSHLVTAVLDELTRARAGVAPQADDDVGTAPDQRRDVYVRRRNVFRPTERTEEIDDGVRVDWYTDSDGMHHVAGVEVLRARGVEIGGLDLVHGRPHGTGPEWRPRVAAALAQTGPAKHRAEKASRSAAVVRVQSDLADLGDLPSDALRQARASLLMQQHYLDPSKTTGDNQSVCVCDQWGDGEMEIGWDDHLAEVLDDAGLLADVPYRQERAEEAARRDVEASGSAS